MPTGHSIARPDRQHAAARRLSAPLAPEPGQPLHLWTDKRGQVGRFWTASFVSTSGRQQQHFSFTHRGIFSPAIGHLPMCRRAGGNVAGLGRQAIYWPPRRRLPAIRFSDEKAV